MWGQQRGGEKSPPPPDGTHGGEGGSDGGDAPPPPRFVDILCRVEEDVTGCDSEGFGLRCGAEQILGTTNLEAPVRVREVPVDEEADPWIPPRSDETEGPQDPEARHRRL